MVAPALTAIIVPVVVGIILGEAGVMGLLIGGLGAGFILAIFLANSGGAWDNAKKYVEDGHFGGKNSVNHHATVVGDTVGDPFKDTSGTIPEHPHQTDEHGLYRDGRTYCHDSRLMNMTNFQ